MATVHATGKSQEDNSKVYAIGSKFYGKTLQDAIQNFKGEINAGHNRPWANVKIRAKVMRDPQARPRTVAATITEINEGQNLIFYTAHEVSITRDEETGIYEGVQDRIKADVITAATTLDALDSVGISNGLARELLEKAAIKLGKPFLL